MELERKIGTYFARKRRIAIKVSELEVEKVKKQNQNNWVGQKAIGKIKDQRYYVYWGGNR